MPLSINNLVAALACMCLLVPAVSAEVYKYRDSRGGILLTDKPMRGLTLLKRYQYGSGRTVRPRRSDKVMAAMRQRKKTLAPLIASAAKAKGLRPALIHAVVRAESAYRSDAVSSKGAVGLMQLMPMTAERYGVTDRRDPAQNLNGGTAYLKDLLAMFDNDLELALAGYNAGENAVIKYGNKIPPYNETQNYVRKVVRFYRSMEAQDKIALR